MNKIMLARDIIVSIGAALAAGAAIYGVGQWRAELKGRVKVGLATRLGKFASRFEAIFSDLRASPGDPWEDRKTAGESRKPLHETYVELMEAKWEAEIVMSKGICELIESIAEEYRVLRRALHEHFFQQEHPEIVTTTPEDLKESRERTKLMYGRLDDEKGKALKGLGNQLKEELRREVSPGYRLKYWIRKLLKGKGC